MVAESYQGTVLITGASTGIGQACALLLDKLGFTVFAGVRQDIDAQALQEKASPRLIPVFLDVTDADSIASVAQKVTNTVGDAGILGLVNNAGIAVPGPLELLPIAEFQHQMNVNVTGQLAVTQAFLGLLRQGSGRIVNMGSIAGRSPTPFLGAYNAYKFATPIWNKSLTQADIGQNSLPESALNLYGRAMNIVRHKMQMIASRGISADIVAQAVVHALTAKQPKTRYLIGQDAKIQAVLKHILPDRLYDRLILYSMGL
jgi:NADP-dependent 3-hydroxy acid dehydrogenase YdfG